MNQKRDAEFFLHEDSPVGAASAALLAQFFDCCPYPVLLFDPSGKLFRLNQSAIKDECLPVPPVSLIAFDLLADPTFVRLGFQQAFQQACQGKTVQMDNTRIPLKEIAARYSVPCPEVDAIVQDVTFFPLKSQDEKPAAIAAMLTNRRVYRGKCEIMQAMAYIAGHSMERLDVDAMARSAGLSQAHFTRLFKKHTGLTPHAYFMSCKIEQIKARLDDENLTIAQAFSTCGVDYSGHYAKVFKKSTGQTPMAYRKDQSKRQIT